MKKAAILTAFSPYAYKGGIETFIANITTLFKENDIVAHVHYIYPEPTLLVKPFPIKVLKKKFHEILLNCFMMGRSFSKIEKQYDLVLSNNYYGLGYFSPNVKSFSIYHSTHAGYADSLKGKTPDYKALKYHYGYIGDYLSGMGKGKIAVSEAVKNELRRYYKFRNVHVVHHGIDTDFFTKIEETTALRKKWNISPDAFVGIFVGRWELGKGIDVLEDMIRHHRDITWIFVTGPTDCPLTGFNNMRVIKHADKEALKELYSLSDFMLFPSYYEGFGLTIIEALACKLPVVCTDVGVARELLRFDPLRNLILPLSGKQTLIENINDRISFLKKENVQKDEIKRAGRAIIEQYYTIALWKKEMSLLLGLSG